MPAYRMHNLVCLFGAAAVLTAQLSFGEEKSKPDMSESAKKKMTRERRFNRQTPEDESNRSIQSVKEDKEQSKSDPSEAAKKRIAREKRFIYRALEELDRSVQFVREDIDLLEKQIDAFTLLEQERRKAELTDMMKWVQNYGAWLSGNIDNFQNDLSGYYFSKENWGGWIGRYGEIAEGYRWLENQLKEKTKYYENNKKEIEKSISERNQTITLLSLRLKEKDEKVLLRTDQVVVSHKLSQADREKRDAKIASDILILQSEIRKLEEVLKHIEILAAKWEIDLEWISLKAGDCEALNAVANAISTGGLDGEEAACRRMIKTYGSDIYHLQKRSDYIDRRLSSISAIGTLSEMNRNRELIEYYESLKSRYYNHINWLKTQIGSYEADIMEIRMMDK